jgi:hypothetical protein
MDTRRRSGAVTHARFDVSFVGSSPSPARRPSRSLGALPLGPCRVALASPARRRRHTAVRQAGGSPANRPSGIRHRGNTAIPIQVLIRLEVKKYASMFLSIPKPQFDNLSSLFILYLVCTYSNPIYQFFVILCTCLGFQSSDV